MSNEDSQKVDASTPARANGELLPKTNGAVPAPYVAGRLSLPVIPDAWGLLRSLRRRWLLAFVLGTVLATLAGTATWYASEKFLPPKYTAYAVLRVASEKPIIAFRTYDPNQARFHATQQALITSKFVLNAALRRPELGKLKCVEEQVDPLTWLARSIGVGFVGGSDLLRISVTGDYPDEVAKLANAVKDAYLDEVVNVERNAHQARISDLQRVYDDWDEKVHTKRTQLQNLARTLGTSKSETLLLREKSEIEVYTDILRERTKLQFDKIRAQAELSFQKRKAEAASKQEISSAIIDRIIDSDPVVLQLRERIANLEDYVARVKKASAHDEIKQLRQAREQLAKEQELLEERLTEMKPIAAEQAQRITNAEVTKIEERIAQLDEQDKILKEQLDHHNVEARTIGTQSVDMEYLRDEIAQIEYINKTLSMQLEQMKVEDQSPPRVVELEKAETPVVPDSARHVRNSTLASAAAFGAVVFFVCWWEFRTHRIDRPNDVEERLGLRIIGTIPAIPAQRSRRSAVSNGSPAHHLYSFLTESVDCVRALLLHESRQTNTRVVMVTSAVGREGKTTLSSHLAASLARTGRRTLFLDGDMRRPTAHMLLEQPLVPGFAEILRGELDWRDAVRGSHIDDLMMIPAGEYDSRALRQLSTETVALLLAQMRDDFDFVIIDSAPLLPVSDSLSIGQHVDGVIFSIMHDVTQLPSLNEAHDRIARLGIRILGAVVSGARGHVYGYNYRNYYSYSNGDAKKALKLNTAKDMVTGSENGG